MSEPAQLDCSDPHDSDFCASGDHAIVCCAKLKSGKACTRTGRYRRDVGQGIAWFCGIHRKPKICACDRIIYSNNPDEKECFTCWKSRTGWVTEMERRETALLELANSLRQCDLCGEYHVCAADNGDAGQRRIRAKMIDAERSMVPNRLRSSLEQWMR